MEKRRVRLEINGILCGVITQESDEYMNGLAKEVGELMQQIQTASPYITREAAALTVALGYCDDAKKSGKKAAELSERAEELEVEVEIWQEETERARQSSGAEPDTALLEKIKRLEQENTALSAAAGQLEQLRQAEQALTDENETLRRTLEEQKQSAAQTGDSALLAQLDELRRENEALMQSSSEWLEELRRTEKTLTEENEALRRTLSEQQQPDPALTAQLEQLKKENEALEETADWLEESRRREQELERENEALREKLNRPAENAAAPNGIAVRKYRENPLRCNEPDSERLHNFYAK